MHCSLLVGKRWHNHAYLMICWPRSLPGPDLRSILGRSLLSAQFPHALGCADLEPTLICPFCRSAGQEAAGKCMLGWFAGAGRRRIQAASWQQRVLTTVREDFRPFIQYACGVYCIHKFVGSATIVTGAQHGAAMSSLHLCYCRCHATLAACRCQHAAHLQCQGRLGAQRAPVCVLSDNKDRCAILPM